MDDHVSGLADLNQSIERISQEVRAKLPELVMQAATLVEAEIRMRAPVDTGRLVSSLDAKAVRRMDAASATVQIERSGPDGTEHYAIFHEFGTSREPARPFFRPGVEAARQQMQDIIIDGVLAKMESEK
ncbi:HK97-gp10 family putative phage morphogenesis protein [Malikia sp.]|uniref:HK97-gp10 family putative phage morphogenesis protein n=1 Tax=Malikia sp. TaxID=2070706 RepID=UPI002605287F|nr:HK97-gp10 family putative phage morphogenesis protein [Malikia sp.]MDD2728175.1 HK97 gp10 family phage protein [Malikia sp.]